MTDSIQSNPAVRAGRPRVLVVYQYVALYRLPVFEALANSEIIDFTFASGVTGHGVTAKKADGEQLSRGPFPWIGLKNYWMPKGFLWQPGVISRSISADYDVVIYLGDMHYLSTWVAAVLRKALNRRLAFWTIGMHRPASGFARAIRRLWFSLPDKILLYGEYGQSLLLGLGQRPEKLSVICNSLDFDHQNAAYQKALAALPEASGVPLIITMGRVTDRRNLDRLIEAVALLRDRGRDLRVRIIGHGPAQSRLEALARELGVDDRIVFLGGVYDEDSLAPHLVEADLCVVPGVIGLAVVHAHTYGCPVITCGDLEIQAPEVEVMAPGETGLFCAWDDSGSVATQIELWLDGGRRRSDVRAACRARVEASWTPAAQRTAIEAAILPLLR